MNQFLEIWNSAAESWWPFVSSSVWQSGLVGIVLLTVVASGKRWPAAVRYAFLIIALLKFAVPPLWSAPTGLLSIMDATFGGSRIVRCRQ